MKKQTTAVATPAGALPTGVPAAAPFAAPGAVGIPAVLISNGKSRGRYYVLIKSARLAPQLRALLNAGIRRVEAVLSVEGNTIAVLASIVMRNASEPPYLYPLREGGKVLSEVYEMRREKSKCRRSGVPLLVLAVAPI
jgi:hypothetical protein